MKTFRRFVAMVVACLFFLPAVAIAQETTPVPVASPVAATQTTGSQTSIAGAWVVRSSDPSIPFGLMQFHTDGTVTAINTNIGAGIGVWLANDDGTVDVNLIFRDIDTNAGAVTPGTVRSTAKATMNASGDRFTVTGSHTIYSPEGDAFGTFDLEETGGRLTFDEIPGWTAAISPAKPALVNTVEVGAATADHPAVGAWVLESDAPASPVSLITLGADGIATANNPEWGTGLGIWAPNVDGTISLLLVFQDIDEIYGRYEPGVSALEGFATVASDGRTLTMNTAYQLIAPDGTTVETGTKNMQGVRMSIASDFTWRTLPEPSSKPPLGDAQAMASHPAVGAWILDASEDPAEPLMLAELHPDGTVLFHHAGIGLALGVWDLYADGTVIVRASWQDLDPSPSAAYPGIFTESGVFAFGPGGPSGFVAISHQSTDASGAVVWSGSYTMNATRMTIDSNPLWDDPNT